MSSVNYIPADYHTLTPYLIVKGAAEAIEFYKKVFDATELMRHPVPGGKIGHAEMKIGDSRLMLADENLEWDAKSASTMGGTPVGLALYVPDCDSIYNRAISLGAKVLKPMADQFYGDRSGTFVDPFGHKWTVATHKEDLTPEQIEQRLAEWMKSNPKPGS
jgi:PhnB protein